MNQNERKALSCHAYSDGKTICRNVHNQKTSRIYPRVRGSGHMRIRTAQDAESFEALAKVF